MKPARTVLTSLAMVWLVGAGAVSLAVGQEDAYGGLPPGAGRATVYAACSGCHSIRLVEQQAMSRKHWDRLLDWMVDKQGMPKPDPETRETVLDYLAEHFGRTSGDGGVEPFNQPQPLMPAN